MAGYLGAIWRCRYFWLSLVKMDLRTRYRRSVLGMGWSLLHPIAMTAILCVMFHRIFGVSIKEFAPYLLAGLAVWNYITTGILQGCQALIQAESYIRQYPAPVAIYPLRTALGATVHFLLALLVVVILAWVFNGPNNLPALVSLVPAVLLLFVLVWSMAVLAAFANVFFPDTQHLAEIGFQLLFYATPIMYPTKQLRDNHLDWLLRYNPLMGFLRLIREPILEGHVPHMKVFAATVVMVGLTAAAAAVALARMQRRIIFHL